MRKAIVTALVLGLVAGSLAAPAEAKKKKKKPKRVERTVEGRYENPMFGAAGTGLCVGCPSFTTAKNETFAMVEIIDDVSPIGYIDLAWDSDGDGVFDTGETVCGKTETPISVPGATELVAFPSAVPSPFCVGSSIAGTVKITFSNLP